MTEPVHYATTVAIMRDLEFLMTETGSDPGAGPIGLPTGPVEPEETAQEAAAAIVTAWTGATFSPAHLILVGIWDRPQPGARTVTTAYATVLPPGTATLAVLGGERAVWLDRDQFAFNTVIGDAWEIARDTFDRYTAGELDWWAWE